MAGYCLTFKGAEGDERLFYVERMNGTWTQLRPILGANSSASPATAIFNGWQHMVWRGAEGDQTLFRAGLAFQPLSEGDQIGLAGLSPIPGANSSAGPALAVFHNQLFAIWKGVEGDQRLFFATFDGNGWTQPSPIPGAHSSTDPSLWSYDHD